MPLDSQSKQLTIESRCGFAEEFTQLHFVRFSRFFRRGEVRQHGMHVFLWDRHMIDQCMPRHSVIAEEIVCRHEPLVAEEQVNMVPGRLSLVFFRPESVKLCRSVSTRQGD